jgi:Amt family ammonium transporter
MAMGSSMVIGFVAGAIVVYSVFFFDRVKIDDPVGALSVHLVCGIWGTLAVGLFGEKAGMGQLGVQAVGVVAYGVATFVSALIIFLVVKAAMGLRVGPEEEMEGLDIGEHGMTAYPDFQSISHVGGHPAASTASLS